MYCTLDNFGNVVTANLLVTNSTAGRCEFSDLRSLGSGSAVLNLRPSDSSVSLLNFDVFVNIPPNVSSILPTRMRTRLSGSQPLTLRGTGLASLLSLRLVGGAFFISASCIRCDDEFAILATATYIASNYIGTCDVELVILGTVSGLVKSVFSIELSACMFCVFARCALNS